MERGRNARSGMPFVPDRAVMEAILERVDKEGRHALSTVSQAWHQVDGQTRASVRIFNCNAARPLRLTRRFRNLKRIKIKGRPRADDFGLIAADWGGYAQPWISQIVGAYPQLVSLHLKRMVVTDEDLRALAPLESLEELILEKCREFSTGGLRSLARCRSLRVLSLRGSQVQEDGAYWLHDWALNNRVLEVLDIDCLEASSINLGHLEELASSLKTLRVPFEVPLRQLRGVLSRTTRLTELGAGCFAEEGGDSDLNIRLPDTIVSLSGLCFVPDLYVPHLQSVAANLLVLDLKAVPALSPSGYALLLSWCCNLEDLQVCHHVGDNVLLAIGQNCKKLRKLCVERVVEDEEANITQRGVLAVVEGCVHLTYFLLYAVDMTNAVLSAVGRNCKELRDFRFVMVQQDRQEYAEKTFDDGLKDLLRGCTTLIRLCFYVRKGSGLTDTGLQHIGTYGKNLKWVLLGCAGSTEMGMTYLGPGAHGHGCRKLEKLELRDCPLSGQCIARLIVDMFPTDLGDPRQFSLRYLWLQNADFRGEEILSLRGLPKPNTVHVEGLPHAAGGNGSAEHHPFQLFAYSSLDGERTDRPSTIVPLDAL